MSHAQHFEASVFRFHANVGNDDVVLLRRQLLTRLGSRGGSINIKEVQLEDCF
jgi:hypothetical protein